MLRLEERLSELVGRRSGTEFVVSVNPIWPTRRRQKGLHMWTAVVTTSAGFLRVIDLVCRRAFVVPSCRRPRSVMPSSCRRRATVAVDMCRCIVPPSCRRAAAVVYSRAAVVRSSCRCAVVPSFFQFLQRSATSVQLVFCYEGTLSDFGGSTKELS